MNRKLKHNDVVEIKEFKFYQNHKNKIGIIRNISTVYSENIPLFVVELYKNGISIDIETYRRNEIRLAKPEQSKKLIDEIEKQEAKEMAKKL